MNLTESRLRTLIEEELNKILDEAPPQRDYKVTEEPIFVRIEGKRYFWPRIKKFLEANPSVDRDMLEKLARMGLLKQYASESIEATVDRQRRKRQDVVKTGIEPDVRGGGPDRVRYTGGDGFPTLPKGTINEVLDIRYDVDLNVEFKTDGGGNQYYSIQSKLKNGRVLVSRFIPVKGDRSLDQYRAATKTLKQLTRKKLRQLNSEAERTETPVTTKPDQAQDVQDNRKNIKYSVRFDPRRNRWVGTATLNGKVFYGASGPIGDKDTSTEGSVRRALFNGTRQKLKLPINIKFEDLKNIKAKDIKVKKRGKYFDAMVFALDKDGILRRVKLDGRGKFSLFATASSEQGVKKFLIQRINNLIKAGPKKGDSEGPAKPAAASDKPQARDISRTIAQLEAYGPANFKVGLLKQLFSNAQKDGTVDKLRAALESSDIPKDELRKLIALTAKAIGTEQKPDTGGITAKDVDKLNQRAAQGGRVNASAAELKGLGTRSILKKVFPGMKIRDAFKKLIALPFSHPARVAYRAAYDDGNRG